PLPQQSRGERGSSGVAIECAARLTEDREPDVAVELHQKPMRSRHRQDDPRHGRPEAAGEETPGEVAVREHAAAHVGSTVPEVRLPAASTEATIRVFTALTSVIETELVSAPETRPASAARMSRSACRSVTPDSTPLGLSRIASGSPAKSWL